MNLENGFLRASEEEQWTLIEMMNKYRDEERNKAISKKKGIRGIIKRLRG